MFTLVEELSNCYDFFWRHSGFPNLFGKVFLTTFKFSLGNINMQNVKYF